MKQVMKKNISEGARVLELGWIERISLRCRRVGLSQWARRWVWIACCWQLVRNDWLWYWISEAIEIERYDQQRNHRDASLGFLHSIETGTGEDELSRLGEIEPLHRFWFTGKRIFLSNRTTITILRRMSVEHGSTISTQQSETPREKTLCRSMEWFFHFHSIRFWISSAFLLLFGGTLIVSVLFICEHAYARFKIRSKRMDNKNENRFVGSIRMVSTTSRCFPSIRIPKRLPERNYWKNASKICKSIFAA